MGASSKKQISYYQLWFPEDKLHHSQACPKTLLMVVLLFSIHLYSMS